MVLLIILFVIVNFARKKISLELSELWTPPCVDVSSQSLFHLRFWKNFIKATTKQVNLCTVLIPIALFNILSAIGMKHENQTYIS